MNHKHGYNWNDCLCISYYLSVFLLYHKASQYDGLHFTYITTSDISYRSDFSKLTLKIMQTNINKTILIFDYKLLIQYDRNSLVLSFLFLNNSSDNMFSYSFIMWSISINHQYHVCRWVYIALKVISYSAI